jgi:hypothetical protein
MTTTAAWPTNPHDAVANETLNLTYSYAERICRSVDPAIMQDINDSPVLSALDSDGKDRVQAVIRERVSHVLESWTMRDRDHWLDVKDDLFAGGDEWVHFDRRAVVACMDEQGFATYAAAELWLARRGEQA